MNINQFTANLKFGGARTSKFLVRITNPANPVADIKVPFLCKAASIPSHTIQPIETFYQGRAIKLAGQRTFEDWNVTLYNDEDFAARNALETWANAINRLENNSMNPALSTPAAYKSTAEVVQMSQDDRELRTYKFIGIWPSSIAAIDLDWSNESIQEQQVTFSYDYFIISDNVTGNGGGK